VAAAAVITADLVDLEAVALEQAVVHLERQGRQTQAVVVVVVKILRTSRGMVGLAL
jgi:hypothetical protein